MKIAKFKDYMEKCSIEISTQSNILHPFSMAKADGVEVLEVSREEWIALVGYFAPDNYWDGKTIWRIKIVVKEPAKMKYK